MVEPDSDGGGLGSFFAAPKVKKKKMRDCATPTPQPKAAAEPAAGAVVIAEDRPRFPSFAPAPREGSSVVKSEASRTAWKLRGMGASPSGASSSTASPRSSGSFEDDELSDLDETPRRRSESSSSSVPDRRGGSLEGKSASGMRRAVWRCSVDSTRCHWLLPPQSLICRVDGETSSFMQRHWLSRASNLSSWPKRLHTGWLAQTLRPMGWLSPIPEDAERLLPMPYLQNHAGDPDPPRGKLRPSAKQIGRVIREELQPRTGDLSAPSSLPRAEPRPKDDEATDQ